MNNSTDKKIFHADFNYGIKITVEVSGETNSPPELQVSESCWMVSSAIFQVLAMSGGDLEGVSYDERIRPFWAIRQLAILGMVFTDIAWNAVDSHLVNPQGGKADG